jgi:hypothetical protein
VSNVYVHVEFGNNLGASKCPPGAGIERVRNRIGTKEIPRGSLIHLKCYSRIEI